MRFILRGYMTEGCVMTVVRAFVCVDFGLSNLGIAIIASIVITAIFMLLAALGVAVIKLGKRHLKQQRHRQDVQLQIRDDLVNQDGRASEI